MAASSKRTANERTTNMNTNILSKAVIPGVIALAAIALSFRLPVNADSILGFATVLTVVGLGALEYRVSWKTIFGR